MMVSHQPALRQHIVHTCSLETANSFPILKEVAGMKTGNQANYVN